MHLRLSRYARTTRHFAAVKQQFQIPIYQRTYSWEREQCAQLWWDVLRVARDPATPSHFLGAVVYIRPGTSADLAISTPKRLIIDGQQRLTTLTLLLCALRDCLRDAEAAGETLDIVADQIHDEYLINKYALGDDKWKLLLTDKDSDTLLRIVRGEPLEALSGDVVSERIRANTLYFRDAMSPSARAKGQFSLADVFAGVGKLMIVEVSLEHGVDDPQLIFESLNSTGRDLSKADLIRNFVLMRFDADTQEQLYRSHWQPMEKAFLNMEEGRWLDYYAAWFDSFARDYLTLKTSNIPVIKRVYEEFKTYAERSDTPGIPNLVADVGRFARHYVRLGFAREDDAELRELMRDINTLEIYVAYPFLLRVVDDFETRKITREALRDVLRLVESYVFRRAVCSIPTQSHNNTFAKLARDAGLDKVSDPANYVQAIADVLIRLETYRRFPGDEEFAFELRTRDSYHTRTVRFLLDKLENWDRHEKIALSDRISVEHILPQGEDLHPQWRAMLGPNWQTVQASHVHTLGNLTLTGYNSSYSARPFLEKRDLVAGGTDIGFKASPYRLNENVRDRDTWDAQAIEERGHALSQRALKIWPFSVS